MRAERTATVSRDLPDRRSAMTLFELLLVLVLLVVVGSLAAPLFEGSFASIRLRRGTDQVLASWSQARTHAIEAGKTYQFRFEPQGGKYRVDPWVGGVDPETLEDDITLTTLDGTDAEVEVANWKQEATLPEEITFTSAESVSTDANGQSSVTRLDQESTTSWSAPIFFYPDGTTSAASLLVKNGKGLYRRATLRALTGVARASALLSREEVDRLKSE